MIIHRVSCAGPDDQNDPDAVAALAAAHPEIEIGIQLSQKNVGTREYPSLAWIQRYAAATTTGRSSLHVNGAWSRACAAGQMPEVVRAMLDWAAPGGLRVFQRIQWNFHAQDDRIDVEALKRAIWEMSGLDDAPRVILQVHAANQPLIDRIVADRIDIDLLFDASLGRGVVRTEWPAAVPGYHCAYAGGIRPETLVETVAKIPDTGACISIDAQRGLRDATGATFMPEREQALVEACRPWFPAGAA